MASWPMFNLKIIIIMKGSINLATTGTLYIYGHSTEEPYSYNRRVVAKKTNVTIETIQEVTRESILMYEMDHPKNKIKCYSIKYE